MFFLKNTSALLAFHVKRPAAAVLPLSDVICLGQFCFHFFFFSGSTSFMLEHDDAILLSAVLDQLVTTLQMSSMMPYDFNKRYLGTL